MPSLIRSPKDFVAGAIFTAAGLAAVLLGRRYSMGTATRMGPAYFPTTLGLVLVSSANVMTYRCPDRGKVTYEIRRDPDHWWKDAVSPMTEAAVKPHVP